MDALVTLGVTFACVLGFSTFVLALNYNIKRNTWGKRISFHLIWLSVFFMVVLMYRLFLLAGRV